MKWLNLRWLQRKKNSRPKQDPFSDDQIRAKAHEIWLSHNGSGGSAEQDWKQAIETLKAEKSILRKVWNWIGINEKKGWDILQPLIVPILLLFLSNTFQQAVKENDQKLADERARQEVLAKYLDQMSELLINKGLRKSKPDSEVFILAQARTATALRGLDTPRQRLLIEFLRSSDLLAPKKRVGILHNVYLADAYLVGTNLSEVNLGKANLNNANLSNADLTLANLSNAHLLETNLSKTNLTGVNFSNANLYRVNFSNANLYGANFSNASFAVSIELKDINKMQDIEKILFEAGNLIDTQLNQAQLCRTKLPSGEISDRDCKTLGIDPQEW